MKNSSVQTNWAICTSFPSLMKIVLIMQWNFPISSYVFKYLM